MMPPRLRPLLLAALIVGVTACGFVVTADDRVVVVEQEPPVAGDDDNIEADEPAQPVAAEPAVEPAATPGAVDAEVAEELVSDDAADQPVRTVPALDPPLEPVGRSSGPDAARAQERLLELGFWVQATTGEYGATTIQAVMAFQKYHGLATDGVLGPITAAALSEANERPTGRSNTGDLAEVDKAKQLVYIVKGGVTEWVLNTSTGSEVPYEEIDQNSPDEIQFGDSVTRNGLFEVNREREEGWWEGDLGEIYRPKYFDGGIAFHGANKVPDYPASHGCVRLSIPAMDWIWEQDIIPKGTPVWVHGEIPVVESDDA